VKLYNRAVPRAIVCMYALQYLSVDWETQCKLQYICQPHSHFVTALVTFEILGMIDTMERLTKANRVVLSNLYPRIRTIRQSYDYRYARNAMPGFILPHRSGQAMVDKMVVILRETQLRQIGWP